MKKILKHPLFLLALGFLVIGASTVGATTAAFSHEAREKMFGGMV